MSPLRVDGKDEEVRRITTGGASGTCGTVSGGASASQSRGGSTVPPTGERTLRADAQRNRDRLLEVAARAFAAGNNPTLEGVAREAGVGIGTLYRHFPTREALVEAAYRNELARLCDAVGDLLQT